MSPFRPWVGFTVLLGCVPEIHLTSQDTGADVGDVGEADHSIDVSGDVRIDTSSTESQDVGLPGQDALDASTDTSIEASADVSIDLSRPVDAPVDMVLVDATPACDGSVCTGSCVDTSRSVLNCGACGRSCPAVLNGSASCSAGSCGSVCDEFHGDCDHDVASGCESNLRTSRGHCGACGHGCAAPEDCQGGRCVVARSWLRRFAFVAGPQSRNSFVGTDSQQHVTAFITGSGTPALGGEVPITGSSSWGNGTLSLTSYTTGGSFRWARQSYTGVVGARMSTSQDGTTTVAMNGGRFDFGPALRGSLDANRQTGSFLADGAAGPFSLDSYVFSRDLSATERLIGTDFSSIIDLGGGVLRSAGEEDVALARVTASGTVRWSMRLGHSGRNLLFGIAARADEGSYALTSLPAEYPSIPVTLGTDSCSLSLVAITAMGVPQWVRHLCVVSNKIAVSGRGTVFVLGSFGASTTDDIPLTFTTDAPDIALIALDSAGAPLWTRVLGGPGYQQASALAADAAGNVYVAGLLGTSLVVDSSGSPIATAAGSRDSFLASFNYAGTLRWVRPLPHEEVQSIAVDSSGALILGGLIAGSSNLADPDMIFGSGDGAFVARFIQP